jgi:hypothetical protein
VVKRKPERIGGWCARCLSQELAAVAADPQMPQAFVFGRNNPSPRGAYFMAFKVPTWSVSMSRARIFSLSCVAALALNRAFACGFANAALRLTPPGAGVNPG